MKVKHWTYLLAAKIKEGDQVEAFEDLHFAGKRVVPQGTLGVVQIVAHRPRAGIIEFDVHWNVRGEKFALKVKHDKIRPAANIDCEVSREV